MSDDRTPANAPGPFYVVRDTCMACGAPEHEARGLMAYDSERRSCYFRRQSETEEEGYRAIRAVWASCCGAVRYDGSDPAISRRLVSAGEADAVDGPSPLEPIRLRPAVSFKWPDGSTGNAVLREIARLMCEGYKNASFVEVPDEVAVRVTYSDRAPTISVSLRRAPNSADRWMALVHPPAHPGARGISLLLSDVLEAANATDRRWYESAGIGGDDDWSSRPI